MNDDDTTFTKPNAQILREANSSSAVRGVEVEADESVATSFCVGFTIVAVDCVLGTRNDDGLYPGANLFRASFLRNKDGF